MPLVQTAKEAVNPVDLNAQLRVVFLTFVGAGLELIPAVPLIWSNSLTTKGYGANPISNPTLVAVGVLVFPLIYCISASLVRPPKRIVLPLYVQALAVTFATLIFVNSLFQYPPAVLQLAVSDMSVTGLLLWFLFMATLVFLGVVQTGVVRLFVGLNGGPDDIDKIAFRINADYKTVAKTMERDDFLDLARLRVVRRSKDMLLLSSSLRLATGSELVLALESGKQPDLSIVSVLSYEQEYYAIAPPSSPLYRDSLVLALGSLLKQLNRSYRLYPCPPETEGTRLAVGHALRVTRPSLATLKGIPGYHKISLIFAGSLAAIMTAAYYFETIGGDLYVSSLVLILVEVAFVFLPALKEAMTRTSNT